MICFCMIEISVLARAEYKLPSFREICICMLVYICKNEVLNTTIMIHSSFDLVNFLVLTLAIVSNLFC